MKPYDVDFNVWITVMAENEDHAYEAVNNMFAAYMRNIERGTAGDLLELDWTVDSIEVSEDYDEEGNPI